MKTAHDLVLEAKQHIYEISLEDALSALAAKPLVLDVREPEEYQLGHLPSATNIPRGILEFRMSQEPTLTDRQREILIYCKNKWPRGAGSGSPTKTRLFKCQKCCRWI